jgi:hypothetical protein
MLMSSDLSKVVEGKISTISEFANNIYPEHAWSEAFQEAIPQWEKQGLWIFYLPEYSPELNLIEILWRFMKYEWIEFWTYANFARLVQYVEGAIKDFGSKYKINFG